MRSCKKKNLEQEEVKGCLKFLTSGLLEAIIFPPALQIPEILQYCINHYDVKSKSILDKDGESLLSITKVTISSILKLSNSSFASFSPS